MKARELAETLPGREQSIAIGFVVQLVHCEALGRAEGRLQNEMSLCSIHDRSECVLRWAVTEAKHPVRTAPRAVRYSGETM